MTVRLNDTLSEFVATSVGKSGSYENVSEYTRDLIRRDKQRVEHEVFERLKAELAQAYSAPDSADRPLTAAEVIARKLSCSRLLFVARFASRKQPGDSWTRSTTTPPGVGGRLRRNATSRAYSMRSTRLRLTACLTARLRPDSVFGDSSSATKITWSTGDTYPTATSAS